MSIAANQTNHLFGWPWLGFMEMMKAFRLIQSSSSETVYWHFFLDFLKRIQLIINGHISIKCFYNNERFDTLNVLAFDFPCWSFFKRHCNINTFFPQFNFNWPDYHVAQFFNNWFFSSAQHSNVMIFKILSVPKKKWLEVQRFFLCWTSRD